MADSEIPVDLMNPGQVFACLGLMEAAEILLGGAMAAFRWEDATSPNGFFRLVANEDEDPVQRVLRFLSKAKVTAQTPQRGAPFPYPEPQEPATLPAILHNDDTDHEIILDHWGDSTRRDNVKFWAGSGGYPGAELLRDALDLVQDDAVQNLRNPFALSKPQTSSFRFDWQRDYIAIDAGFSPNKHSKGHITMQGYPLVEILAAIGMSNARPLQINKLRYEYGVIGMSDDALDPIFLRAALGAKASPMPGTQPDTQFRRFAMILGWPGQEDQARCITDVFEISGQEEDG